jgi:Tfp pilus assembly protein PilV
MNKPVKKRKLHCGFTLVELSIVMFISVIVILGLGIVLADSERSWQKMYERANGQVETDTLVAQKTFNAIVRKAVSDNFLLDTSGHWVEVYYSSSDTSALANRYARFYCTSDPNGQVNVEYGQLNPKQTLSTQTLCNNVSSCVFKKSGKSILMILTLSKDSLTLTAASSAFMHNQQ